MHSVQIRNIAKAFLLLCSRLFPASHLLPPTESSGPPAPVSARLAMETGDGSWLPQQ